MLKMKTRMSSISRTWKCYDCLFANVTRCDILHLMQWHIIYFNCDIKSIILNSTSLSTWNLRSITASNRDTFSFPALIYSPSSLRCMHVKQRPGFFETSAKSVWFDKIRFTYEIAYVTCYLWTWNLSCSCYPDKVSYSHTLFFWRQY